MIAVAAGWFRVSVGLAEVLYKEGVSWARMLGGFKVDIESVWVGLGLICARCAAGFCSSLWAASGM